MSFCCGCVREHVPPPEVVPTDDARLLRQAEAELERLRGIVRNQAQALKIAGKVLAPYLARYG